MEYAAAEDKLFQVEQRAEWLAAGLDSRPALPQSAPGLAGLLAATQAEPPSAAPLTASSREPVWGAVQNSVQVTEGLER